LVSAEDRAGYFMCFVVTPSESLDGR